MFGYDARLQGIGLPLVGKNKTVIFGLGNIQSNFTVKKITF